MSHSSQAVPKWTRAETRPAMERKFRFQNRIAAWGFLAKLAVLLDKDDFYVEWAGNRVKVILTWDDTQTQSEPLELAEKINEVV
ncbi:4a-hydroxytetrahydrobiopterin dehydratase [Roseococcus sp. SDR]|uniref:4a-hydroxytetrahydrobiopterin dehydratase n=1 Tax=Roseococcus sp. SDR TaxID=2835532 RepID=UPI001BD01BA7|nr:4a-hydroxytetrahydrobiopterin dehydratase [Roseococcus sp. SDR]MBS7792635.1 4a-hydroxytetrahydrobiopterin dehydratase [Roseococcus sp. SDR]MBV1847949.1 4a-hydroxytetrahydrobiopterin dehydratase [Roseococcus sp. SDR]